MFFFVVVFFKSHASHFISFPRSFDGWQSGQPDAANGIKLLTWALALAALVQPGLCGVRAGALAQDGNLARDSMELDLEGTEEVPRFSREK